MSETTIKLPVTSEVFTCQDGRTDFWEYRDGDGLPLDAEQIVTALNESDALRGEVERLKDALRGIRDMPERDQDDEHRLRNAAGVALGKADKGAE